MGMRVVWMVPACASPIIELQVRFFSRALQLDSQDKGTLTQLAPMLLASTGTGTSNTAGF